jgi:hypothetical protein
MKSISSAIQKIRTEVRQEVGKAPKLDNGLKNLATVANEFKEKSNRALHAVSKAIGGEGLLSESLKNIRHQIHTISRGLDRMAIDMRQQALELMSKPAAKSGFHIDIRAGWSAAVKSDLTVVSGESALFLMKAAEVKYKEKESDTAKAVKNFFFNNAETCHRFTTLASAAKEMVCLSRIGLEINPDDIEKRIFAAVGDSTGAIVIEIQPDGVVNGHPTFSDDALKANLAAARRLNSDARQKHIDRAVTFILPPQNSEVLERLQAFNSKP